MYLPINLQQGVLMARKEASAAEAGGLSQTSYGMSTHLNRLSCQLQDSEEAAGHGHTTVPLKILLPRLHSRSAAAPPDCAAPARRSAALPLHIAVPLSTQLASNCF